MRLRLGVSAAIAAAVFLVAPAAARPSQAELDAAIARLTPFVQLVTGYKVAAKPRFVFRSQIELDKMYFGEDWKPTIKNWIGALAKNNVVFLNEDFELGRDDYILVHELTHVLQFENGKAEGCAGEREPEAYRVQDIFVAATGRGVKSDPFTVAVIAMSCHAQ